MAARSASARSGFAFHATLAATKSEVSTVRHLERNGSGLVLPVWCILLPGSRGSRTLKRGIPLSGKNRNGVGVAAWGKCARGGGGVKPPYWGGGHPPAKFQNLGAFSCNLGIPQTHFKAYQCGKSSANLKDN